MGPGLRAARPYVMAAMGKSALLALFTAAVVLRWIAHRLKENADAL